MYWLVAVVVLWAALFDWRQRRIPNRLTLPLLLAGLSYHLISGGMSGLGWSVAGMALAGGLLLVFYLLGATGAGDVKLAAAIGAWCGPAATFLVLAYAALAGGAVALLWVLAQCARCRSIEPLRSLGLRLVALWIQPRVAPEVVRSARFRHRSLPYAVPIAAGFWYWLVGGGVGVL